MGKKKKNISSKISRVNNNENIDKLSSIIEEPKSIPEKPVIEEPVPKSIPEKPVIEEPVPKSIPEEPVPKSIPEKPVPKSIPEKSVIKEPVPKSIPEEPVPKSIHEKPVKSTSKSPIPIKEPHNIFKGMIELKKSDTSKLSNDFIQKTYHEFYEKQEKQLKKLTENSNKIVELNKSINEFVANIKTDIVELNKLHKDLMENKLHKKNLHYVDSIFFQKNMIEVELYSNQKIQRKYLNKFYSDLYNIILSIKNNNEEKGVIIKIPDNILKYYVLYDSIPYEYDDIFNAMKFISEHQITSINNIISDFDFIHQMETKEEQGYCLKEFNTNLNYKILNKMSYINYVFEKVNYIVAFQLKFANKFNNKMNVIADEVDIKY